MKRLLAIMLVGLLGLTINPLDWESKFNEQQAQIQDLQIENEELRSDLEMANYMMTEAQKEKVDGKHYKPLLNDWSVQNNVQKIISQSAPVTIYWSVGEAAFLLKQNEIYSVRIVGKVISAENTTGFTIGFKSSSAATILGVAKGIIGSSVTEQAIHTVSSVTIVPVLVMTDGDDTDGAIFILDFVIKFTSADGGLELYGWSEVDLSQITIKAGSLIIIEKAS